MSGNRYTALLDACVLFPATVSNALMSLHHANLFAARWTQRIDAEWIRNARARMPDIEAARFERRRDLMHDAVPSWEIEPRAYEPLMAGLALPDAGDAHVLAAAIAGHCNCLVTANLKHFPADVLEPFGIEPIHPDDFIINQIDLDEVRAFTAFKVMRARFRNPPKDPEAFAVAFERSGLVSTAQRLRDVATLI
jgi:hypothetical protein